MARAILRSATARERNPSGKAVASRALAPVLDAEPRVGRVMGVTSNAWWCAAEEDVVVVTFDDDLRLPNSIVARCSADEARMRAGDTVVIGDRRMACAAGDWQIARWWDPHVASTVTDRSAMVRHLRFASDHVPSQGSAFAAALRHGDPDEAVAAAIGIVGLGPGLTPASDDYLVGAIAAYGYIACCIGDAPKRATLGETRERLLACARAATTLLSYSLLRHAYDRNVAAPVGSLLRALTGRGDLAAALAATLAVGSSSGPALARGVLDGAAAGLGRLR